jgi:mannose-6-phosphate isomerase-like protein (cupin superfamily)
VRINVITMFPGYFDGPLQTSIVGRAIEEDALTVVVQDLRDYGVGKHRQLPKNGTRIRVLDIPPDTDEMKSMDPATARAHFASIGAAEASTHKVDSSAPHPFMHRTETVDYGIVLEGELVLILDQGETTVRAGDIVIQRGTNHAWANRSEKNCRIAFILIDGEFTEGL